MPSQLASYPNDKILSANYGFHEDFETPYVLGSTAKLNNSSNNSGTFVIGQNTAGGGNLPLVTGASTNNYNYAYSPAMFVMAGDQPLRVQSQIQWTDANVNTMNVVFGVWSATIATILADTTFLPSTSATGALFFKQSTKNYWQTCSSIGTTQTLTNLNTTKLFNGVSASGTYPQITTDANDHVLSIELYPAVSGSMEARYFIDGAFVWKDLFSYTSPVIMYAVVGCKNGDGNAQTLNVRNFWCRQKRPSVANILV